MHTNIHTYNDFTNIDQPDARRHRSYIYVCGRVTHKYHRSYIYVSGRVTHKYI